MVILTAISRILGEIKDTIKDNHYWLSNLVWAIKGIFGK